MTATRGPVGLIAGNFGGHLPAWRLTLSGRSWNARSRLLLQELEKVKRPDWFQRNALEALRLIDAGDDDACARVALLASKWAKRP